MRKINQNAETVHLGDHLPPESGQTAAGFLHAAGANQVLRIVRELGHTNAQIIEDWEEVQPVLDRRCVLPSENDADAALLSRLFGVADTPHRPYEIGMPLEALFPRRDPPDRFASILPDTAGAIGGPQGVG